MATTKPKAKTAANAEEPKPMELATPAPASVATLPDYLVGTEGMGNENVGARDVSLPTLRIIQALSPQLDKSQAEWIQGAEQGDVINTLTGQLEYKQDEKIRLLDVGFQKVYALFREHKFGGGFRGQFETEQEAAAALDASDDKKQLEIVETAIHIVLLLNPDGTPKTYAGIFFAKSGLKWSKKLNGMLRDLPYARFARVVELEIVPESNDKGKWFSFSPKLTPEFAAPAAFDAALRIYKSLGNVSVSAKDAQPDAHRPDADDSY